MRELTVFSHRVDTLSILRDDGVARTVFLSDALDFLDEGERSVRLGLVDPDGIGAAEREVRSFSICCEAGYSQVGDVSTSIGIELDSMGSVALWTACQTDKNRQPA